jgi:membrane protein implicated in regulation of membrane protease activity
MIALSAWHIWMIIGIVFVIIEILDPAFFFIAFGIAAILTGLLCLIGSFGDLVVLQIFTFAILSFISFLLMRKLGKKVLAHPAGETNVFALKGQIGSVTKEIPAEGKGYVKVGGEEWAAVEETGKPIAQNAKVKVLNIEGNKLIVTQAN